jgi:hypothetical protein
VNASVKHGHPAIWRARDQPGLWLRSSILAACLMVGAVCVARAQPAAREHEVKAALLFNFSQFVEWPATADLPGDSFIIGILGDDPFGKSLDELVANERAHGRPIEVRRYRDVLDVKAQILFISNSEALRFDSVLASLKGKPILLVSDTGRGSFLRQGGMIELVMENNSIRMRINPDAARSSGLAISAKVLELAEIVGSHTQ